MFSVVIFALIDQHLSNSEELMQIVETLDAFCALCYYELMKYLIAGLAALSASPRISDQAYGEAPFSVYKTSNSA